MYTNGAKGASDETHRPKILPLIDTCRSIVWRGAATALGPSRAEPRQGSRHAEPARAPPQQDVWGGGRSFGLAGVPHRDHHLRYVGCTHLRALRPAQFRIVAGSCAPNRWRCSTPTSASPNHSAAPMFPTTIPSRIASSAPSSIGPTFRNASAACWTAALIAKSSVLGTTMSIFIPASGYSPRKPFTSARRLTCWRQIVLDAAFFAHPERFVQKPPTSTSPPTSVWINPPVRPNSEEQSH